MDSGVWAIIISCGLSAWNVQVWSVCKCTCPDDSQVSFFSLGKYICPCKSLPNWRITTRKGETGRLAFYDSKPLLHYWLSPEYEQWWEMAKELGDLFVCVCVCLFIYSPVLSCLTSIKCQVLSALCVPRDNLFSWLIYISYIFVSCLHVEDTVSN